MITNNFREQREALLKEAEDDRSKVSPPMVSIGDNCGCKNPTILGLGEYDHDPNCPILLAQYRDFRLGCWWEGRTVGIRVRYEYGPFMHFEIEEQGLLRSFIYCTYSHRILCYDGTVKWDQKVEDETTEDHKRMWDLDRKYHRDPTSKYFREIFSVWPYALPRKRNANLNADLFFPSVKQPL